MSKDNETSKLNLKTPSCHTPPPPQKEREGEGKQCKKVDFPSLQQDQFGAKSFSLSSLSDNKDVQHRKYN